LSQRKFTGGAQWRQVDLYDIPKAIFPYGVIFVAQAIAGRSYFVPRLTRRKRSGQTAQFGRGFADSFEAPLDRVVGFLILAERNDVHTCCGTLDGLYVFDNVFEAA